MENLAVILAAGRSSRFASPKSKLLQELGNSTIVGRVVCATVQANYHPIIIIGHQGDLVKACIEKDFQGLCTFAQQTNPRGTGDAFATAAPFFKNSTTHILVINGDNPFVTSQLLTNFSTFVAQNNIDIALVSSIADDPYGYGRIILVEKNKFLIIEEKDLSSEQKSIDLINGGIYLFSKDFLEKHLQSFIKDHRDPTREINITDLFNLASTLDYKMGHYTVAFSLVRGVNDLNQYAQAKMILGMEKIDSVS